MEVLRSWTLRLEYLASMSKVTRNQISVSTNHWLSFGVKGSSDRLVDIGVFCNLIVLCISCLGVFTSAHLSNVPSDYFHMIFYPLPRGLYLCQRHIIFHAMIYPLLLSPLQCQLHADMYNAAIIDVLHAQKSWTFYQ